MKMKQHLLILAFLLATLTVQAHDWLPQYGDSYWLNAIPKSMRQSYIENGEQYLGKAWTTPPVSVFAEYKKTGNRINYEALLLEKRRQFSALVLAEIMEGKGRFMPDIIKGLESTLNEIWWGYPAHYESDCPKPDVQTVDLVNAETASMIAYTRYVLSSELESYSPHLIERIDSEINRRMLTPALEANNWWKNATSNWNPWICSNWLACVLLCEHDETRKTEAITQINKACKTFINAYPDDGGCDEGPSYWDRATASLFEICYLLSMSHNQAPIQFNDPKLKAMGAYIYKMYAGNGNVVNFSDTYGHRASMNVNITYLFGLKIGDKVLSRYAAWYGQQKDIIHNAGQLFKQSANWPSLGRELIFLNHIRAFLKEKPREPKVRSSWLPELQVMTSRTSSRKPFFVAYKGGHNGESHNHNDVGSFIVYANGEPLFIDLGVGEYNAQTFSDKRFEIWTMQSDYHNLPRINGQSQKAGKQYKADVVGYRNGELTLDISNAYPNNANVNKWYRTVSTRLHKRVTVIEEFELSSYGLPSQLVFVSPIEPVVIKDGQINLNNCSLLFNHNQLSPEIEDISSYIDPVMSRVWGQHLYRIILNVRSQKIKQTIQYYISYK